MQLLNSIRRGKPLQVKSQVAVPRLALEVRVGEVNAAIEGLVRRPGYYGAERRCDSLRERKGCFRLPPHEWR